jgi:hypothetical protein
MGFRLTLRAEVDKKNPAFGHKNGQFMQGYFTN